MKCASGVGGLDAQSTHERDISCVHPLIESHHRDPSLGLSSDERPLNGRGASIIGQEAPMEINAPPRREVEITSGENLSVGDDHSEIIFEGG
jgi:hypothetical protein